MLKPRIIIADTDLNYIIPIQLKFVETYFDKVDLEIITDKAVFTEIFSTPQQADVLIVSEDLYENSLCRHNLKNIYIMTEQEESVEQKDELTHRIYKYTNIKAIFSQITNNCLGSSSQFFHKHIAQIILVTSANGGVGKTTISLAISGCLATMGKRVLYINADHLQSFQYLLKDQSPISDMDVYTKLSASSEIRYADFRHVIRNESFLYLPPFKTILIALGISFSVYEKIAVAARDSGEYDYVILDVTHILDESKTKLFKTADRVIFITRQNPASVFSINLLASNITGLQDEKYVFVCNKFDSSAANALSAREFGMKFLISEYIKRIPNCDRITIDELAKNSEIQRVAFLIM